MRDTLFPIVWVGVAITLITFLYFALKKSRRIEEEEAESRRAAIADGIERKVLLPNGKPACIVCQQSVATERWPVIQRSWLDRITFFKDLYALTPRYSIEDGEGEDYELLLCKHHKRMCVQKWNELLAAKRTQIQSVFSQIEAELAQMEGGAMLFYLQSQHENSMEKLTEFLGTAPRPMLRSSNSEQNDHISLPPMTTENGKDKTEATN